MKVFFVLLLVSMVRISHAQEIPVSHEKTPVQIELEDDDQTETRLMKALAVSTLATGRNLVAEEVTEKNSNTNPKRFFLEWFKPSYEFGTSMFYQKIGPDHIVPPPGVSAGVTILKGALTAEGIWVMPMTSRGVGIQIDPLKPFTTKKFVPRPLIGRRFMILDYPCCDLDEVDSKENTGTKIKTGWLYGVTSRIAGGGGNMRIDAFLQTGKATTTDIFRTRTDEIKLKYGGQRTWLFGLRFSSK